MLKIFISNGYVFVGTVYCTYLLTAVCTVYCTYLLTAVCTVYCTYLLRYVQCTVLTYLLWYVQSTVLTYCGLYRILTLEVEPEQILHDEKRKLQNTSIHVFIIDKQLGQLIMQTTTWVITELAVCCTLARSSGRNEWFQLKPVYSVQPRNETDKTPAKHLRFKACLCSI